MHMWVISVGRHLSRTHKKSNASAEDRPGDPSIYILALYHVTIKAGLYRKEVQVYDIPSIYPVTLVPDHCLSFYFSLLNYVPGIYTRESSDVSKYHLNSEESCLYFHSCFLLE